MNEIWVKLVHQDVEDGYEISSRGRVRAKSSNIKPITANYHSTNGYDFIPLIPRKTSDELLNHISIKYFPIDELLATAFIPIPLNLEKVKLQVRHIDGDTRNNDLSNLEWIEDVEEWRTLKEFPMYAVSNHGRIKNIETSKILQGNTQQYVYYGLRETKGSKQLTRLCHRLVASEFVQGYQEGFQVNHIDEVKTNNHFKNLEWISASDNLNFGEHNLKISISMGSRIRCIETGEIYQSATLAGNTLNIDVPSITACCGGTRRTAGGYHWEWVDKAPYEISACKEFAVDKYGKKVKCIETGKIYRSLTEAARDCRIGRSHIADCCVGKRTTCGGYHWEWVDNS